MSTNPTKQALNDHSKTKEMAGSQEKANSFSKAGRRKANGTRKGSHSFGTSAFRLVANTFPRFISILLITTIGVAFFSGLRITGNYMRVNADAYLNSHNTMDIRIVSTYGFDDSDIQAIRNTPGVLNVYPGYNANIMAFLTTGAVNAQVLSIDTRPGLAQNQPYLFSGRLPAKSGECLVEVDYIRRSGKGLGDSVYFTSGNDKSLFDTLKYESFTIVGVADSPLFLAEDRGSSSVGNGSNSYFFLIPEEDFSLSVHTEVYIRISSVEANDSRFSQGYQELVAEEIKILEQTADLRAPLRYAAVVKEASDELADAQAEVDQGYKDLEDAWQELLDARRELDDAWSMLYDSRLSLDDAWLEINDAEQGIKNGWAELDESRQLLDEAWEELAASRTLLDEGWAEAEAGYELLEENRALVELAAQALQFAQEQLDNASAWLPPVAYNYLVGLLAQADEQYQVIYQEWASGLDQYYEAVAELEEGEDLYQAGYQELVEYELDYTDGASRLYQAEADFFNGLRKLQDGEDEYSKGLAEVKTGELEYADGLAEYQTEQAKAITELEDAQREIDEAWLDLEKLKAPQWYVLGIRDNAGFRTFDSEAAQLDALALILPAFFFLIAALVSMTAMTRLVDSERTTIATFKALGYKNTVISLRYLLYALAATSIGSAIGIALGFSILPSMIFDAFRTLFNIPHTLRPFSIEYSLISSAVAVFSTVLPALSVVRSSVRENPAQAMRPLAPKAGRRIFLERLHPLWRRLSFLQKITARNLFRYKKRLLMTIFGVAGCTGLIFTSLALNDALGTVTIKQFGMVYKSDVTIDFKLSEGDSLADLAGRVSACSDVLDYTPIYQRSMRISSPELTKDISVIVAIDPEALPNFILMQSRGSLFNAPEAYTLDDQGVILTEQIARQFGVKIGDSIELRTLEGDSATFIVAGIVENYTMHYCYMTMDTYSKAYGEKPEPNRFFVRTISGRAELPKSLLDDQSIQSISYTTKLAAEVSNQLDVLTFVVVILIISAGILIFVVLFSLITINLEERRRELASIKVLGFYEHELASYIYRENVILTIVGSIVGIGLGILLQRYIITTLEIDMFMFSRDMLWPSYVIALALTFTFAAFVNLIMYRPLTRIDMVEALKAVE